MEDKAKFHFEIIIAAIIVSGGLYFGLPKYAVKYSSIDLNFVVRMNVRTGELSQCITYSKGKGTYKQGTSWLEFVCGPFSIRQAGP